MLPCIDPTMFASMTVSLCKSMLHAQVLQSRKRPRARESSDSRVAVANYTGVDEDQNQEKGDNEDGHEEKVGAQACSPYYVTLVAGSHVISYMNTLVYMNVAGTIKRDVHALKVCKKTINC